MNKAVSGKECGEALKSIANRIQRDRALHELPELLHICPNCKHRKTKTYIREDWGLEQVFHNWCGLNSDYMDVCLGKGNGEHFTEPCEHFEVRE